MIFSGSACTPSHAGSIICKFMTKCPWLHLLTMAVWSLWSDAEASMQSGRAWKAQQED